MANRLIKRAVATYVPAVRGRPGREAFCVVHPPVMTPEEFDQRYKIRWGASGVSNSSVVTGTPGNYQGRSESLADYSGLAGGQFGGR